MCGPGDNRPLCGSYLWKAIKSHAKTGLGSTARPFFYAGALDASVPRQSLRTVRPCAPIIGGVVRSGPTAAVQGHFMSLIANPWEDGHLGVADVGEVAAPPPPDRAWAVRHQRGPRQPAGAGEAGPTKGGQSGTSTPKQIWPHTFAGRATRLPATADGTQSNPPPDAAH